MCYGVGARCGSDSALLWLWCRPSNYSSDLNPSLGTFICHRCGPKGKKERKQKKKKTKKKKKTAQTQQKKGNNKNHHRDKWRQSLLMRKYAKSEKNL